MNLAAGRRAILVYLLATWTVSSLFYFLSASGMAAVMALSVSQRTREIGVRMALGAPRGSVVGMVVRQGIVLTVAGIVAGTLFVAMLTKLLASLLYGTSPTDLLTFAAIPVVFLLVAARASGDVHRSADGVAAGVDRWHRL